MCSLDNFNRGAKVARERDENKDGARKTRSKHFDYFSPFSE